MPVNFKDSKTKENLMRAFAGESQARNRYTFAAEEAAAQKLYVVEAIFKFTAEQELAHAEVFYEKLKECTGENICVDGCYPVDITNSIVELLEKAEHNELEEYGDAYKNFADVAEQEGFLPIANTFRQIAEIEKTHAERFGTIAKLLREDKLFVADAKVDWMCLNCGNIINTEKAPSVCPVCSHARGYFVRLAFAPYTSR
ncbi:MAG: rubrerythrin family protein [Clostridia bacterium]|nr:rubrerythrin family protein [Clostridia bacterium]